MNIDRIRELYYNPPRNNDIAGWAEIHKAVGTPDGSDHAMRQWAMQRMGKMLIEEANRNECDCGMVEHGRHHMDCPSVKCNNVAPTATLAQDATEVQPSQTASHEAGSDHRADLEAMRKDLQGLWDFAHHRVRLGTAMAKNLAAMRAKWGLV